MKKSVSKKMTERQKFICKLRKKGLGVKEIEKKYQERFAAETCRSKIINILAQFGYWRH